MVLNWEYWQGRCLRCPRLMGEDCDDGEEMAAMGEETVVVMVKETVVMVDGQGNREENCGKRLKPVAFRNPLAT